MSKAPVLTALYLKKSHDKLKTARLLLEEKRFEDSVSRSYYAAFLAANAALAAHGLRADTHRGVATLFSVTFLKTGKMRKNLAKFLANLREDREAGDYEAYSWIDEATAKSAYREAEQFVKEVEAFLKKENLLA